MAEDTVQFTLRAQVGKLAKGYFPAMNRVPGLMVVKEADNNGHGPAWLNALTGTINIDERVSTPREDNQNPYTSRIDSLEPIRGQRRSRRGTRQPISNRVDPNQKTRSVYRITLMEHSAGRRS